MSRPAGGVRFVTPSGGNPREQAEAINNALKGKIGSTGSITLTANAASTTVNNSLVGASSAIFLFPQTAHAGAELAAGGCYIAPTGITDGTSFVITHANNAQADRTFFYVILGG